MTKTIEITVNGEPRSVGDPTTVHELLEQLDLKTGRIAIEVNREILPRARHDARLRDGDRVEIVTFVGGG